MKRILSILITLLMVFSVTASAHSLEDIGMMRNYEAEMDLTITFDKPITLFDKLPELKDAENFVDLNELVQSLIGTTVNAKVQGNISEDFSKIQASVLMTSTTPLKINKNAKITGEFIMGVWVDADLSDTENPKFDMIMQSPFFNKYLDIDLIEMLKEDEEAYGMFMSSFKGVFDKEKFAIKYNEAIDLIKKNATISSGNNTLNVNFDKDGAARYLYDAVEWSLKLSAAQQDELYIEEYEQISNDMLKVFKELEIFGENGIKMQYTFDRAGKLKASTSVTDIDLNLYPLLSMAWIDVSEITEEDCFISFTINESATYRKAGTTTVEYPKLTEENSFTLKDLDGGYEEPDYEYEYEDFPPYFPSVEGEWAARTESGVLYAGLRGFLENIDQHHYTEEDEINHFEYEYANGVLNVKNIGCNYLNFKEIVITVGENKVLLDGVEIELENPATEINDRIFLGLDFYEKAFNYKPGYASLELFENIYYIQFELNEEF